MELDPVWGHSKHVNMRKQDIKTNRYASLKKIIGIYILAFFIVAFSSHDKGPKKGKAKLQRNR